MQPDLSLTCLCDYYAKRRSDKIILQYLIKNLIIQVAVLYDSKKITCNSKGCSISTSLSLRTVFEQNNVLVKQQRGRGIEFFSV